MSNDGQKTTNTSGTASQTTAVADKGHQPQEGEGMAAYSVKLVSAYAPLCSTCC